MGDDVGGVQAGADRHQGTAVVAGQREPVVAERLCRSDDVGGHRALG
ncbi:hypothetical protein [Geodermatophilus amargosae]|nr:hypothetical protein [Geodermatophilus amargosae]